jgi:histone arginine demethylase JMJD6
MEIEVERLDEARKVNIIDCKNWSSQHLHQPMKILGLLSDWKATTRWKKQQLIEQYGQSRVRLGSDEQTGERVELALEEYIEYCETTLDDSPLYVINELEEHESLLRMQDDYQVPSCFLGNLMEELQVDGNFWNKTLLTKPSEEKRPPSRWIHIGPARSGLVQTFVSLLLFYLKGIHVDPFKVHNWLALIEGKKRWALFPPEIQSLDWITESSMEWFVDIYPTIKDKYQPLECIQYPGEVLFVPSGWHHVVLNISPFNVAIGHR